MTRWSVILILCVGTVAMASDTYIPSYSARYSSGEDVVLREILAELKIIRAELQSFRRQGGMAIKPAANLKEFITGRCAACHGETTADKKGASFVLLTKEGQVPALSLAEKKRMIRLTGRGEMPPGAPMTEDEKVQLNDFLFPKEDMQ